jgi:hypothetical protein
MDALEEFKSELSDRIARESRRNDDVLAELEDVERLIKTYRHVRDNDPRGSVIGPPTSRGMLRQIFSAGAPTVRGDDGIGDDPDAIGSASSPAGVSSA